MSKPIPLAIPSGITVISQPLSINAGTTIEVSEPINSTRILVVRS